MIGNLIIMVLLTFLFDGSVATTQRSFSPFLNPAGTALSPGLELSYVGSVNDIDTTHNIGILLGNLGFGTSIINRNTNYYLAGSARINDWLSIGSEYKFGDIKGYSIGTIIRPHRFLSLGLVGDKIEKRFVWKSGIGIRPGTDRLTVSLDYDYDTKDETSDYLVGLKIEPLEGIFLEGYGNEDQWRAGISISFGKFGVGGGYGETGDLKNYNAGILFSNEVYQTFLKPEPSLADFKLEGSYPEIEISEFFFQTIDVPFYKLIKSIKELTENDACSGIILELNRTRMSLNKWEELRDELSRFRSKGKKIYVYSTDYGIGSLYLSSIADSIFIHPLGDVLIPGIQIRRMYLKGTMEKIGVKAQVEKVGKFKSAPETFGRTDMSTQDSLQYMEFLKDVFYPMVETIASARGMPKDSLHKLIDEGIFFNSEEAIEAGLVDAALRRCEIDSILETKAKEFKDFGVVNREWKTSKEKIALVIADGLIIQGKSSQGYIGSDDMVKTLEKIRDDRSIKAVVLRVNSGGGDGLASELITEVLKDIAERKVLVVSMGGVAGSGGYMIAMHGDKIYADNSTLTGSIGVFWLGFVFKGLYDKLGITWDILKLGEHADALSDIHEWDEYEREKVKSSVKWFYDRFVGEVASARDTTWDYIHSIGEGRVWSAIKGRELGLLDEVGGLLDAIDEAQSMAGIEERAVDVYPKPRPGIGFSMGGNIPIDYLKSLMSLLSAEYLYMIPYIVDLDVK